MNAYRIPLEGQAIIISLGTPNSLWVKVALQSPMYLNHVIQSLLAVISTWLDLTILRGNDWDCLKGLWARTRGSAWG